MNNREDKKAELVALFPQARPPSAPHPTDTPDTPPHRDAGDRPESAAPHARPGPRLESDGKPHAAPATSAGNLIQINGNGLTAGQIVAGDVHHYTVLPPPRRRAPTAPPPGPGSRSRLRALKRKRACG